jgi:hypothetical protein
MVSVLGIKYFLMLLEDLWIFPSPAHKLAEGGWMPDAKAMPPAIRGSSRCGLSPALGS